MPQAVFEVVASDPLFAHLPFSIDQKSSRASGLILIMLLVPGLVTLLVPLGLLAAFAAPVLSIAAENPAAAAQVLLGLGLWTVLFVIPGKRIVQHFGTGRKVCIDAGLVTVSENGAMRSRVWSVPLAEYCGLAHHVRATLSGLRHELILVHRSRPKSVLLHTADHIAQSTIEQAAALSASAADPCGRDLPFARPRPTRFRPDTGRSKVPDHLKPPRERRVRSGAPRSGKAPAFLTRRTHLVDTSSIHWGCRQFRQNCRRIEAGL